MVLLILGTTYASDGLHYSESLYKAIWEQVMTNSSSSSGGDEDTSGIYDCIIIGDSLITGMCGAYTGVYGSKSTTVNGKEVMFLGRAREGHDYWFKQHYQEIQNALKDAKNGAACIIYSGGNDYWENDKYVNSMNKMATEFQGVNVYFCSYPHSSTLFAGEPRESYNKSLDKFNDDVYNGMKKCSRFNKNLFYKEINDNKLKIGNVTKTLDHFVMDDKEYLSDQDHFAAPLYKAVCEQIFLKLTKTSSSSKKSKTRSSGGGSTTFDIYTAYSDDIQEKREVVQFDDVFKNSDLYTDVGDLDEGSKEEVEKKAGKVVSVITNIGVVISILMPALIGIKYMIMGKMEAKKDLVPYFVGAVMLFSICIITKILLIMGNAINSI